jgi:hypothetical protein
MLGSRAVYTTHSPSGCPLRDVASLHVRHGQLTWLDSHQLDCILVGCSFPHYAFLTASHQGLWDLSCWQRFRPWAATKTVVIEESQSLVQPGATPPVPAKASTLPGPHHRAPDFPLNPVSNVGKTSAGPPDAEVVHPAAHDRVDLGDQSPNRLRATATRDLAEL